MAKSKAAPNGDAPSKDAMGGIFRESASPTSSKAKGKAKAVDAPATRQRSSRSRSAGTAANDGNESSSSYDVDGEDLAGFNRAAQQGKTGGSKLDQAAAKGKSKSKSKPQSTPENEAGTRKRRRSLALSDDSSSDGDDGETITKGAMADSTQTSSTLSDPEDTSAGVALSESGGSLHGSDSEPGLAEWTKRDQKRWQDRYKYDEDDADYAVDRIIRWRRHPRKDIALYRVKWDDPYDEYWNSWEPAINFNGTKAIDEFWKGMELSGQGRRPLNCHPRHEPKEYVFDSEDTDAEIFCSDPARRKAARRRKRRDIRADRKAMQDFYRRRNVLQQHEKQLQERKREEKRQRKDKERLEKGKAAGSAKTGQAAASSKPASVASKVNTLPKAASVKRTPSKSLSPEITHKGSTAVGPSQVTKEEADRQREIARQFLPKSDQVLKQERRIARGTAVPAKATGKAAAMSGKAESSAARNAASSTSSSAAQPVKQGFRGAHHTKPKVKMFSPLDRILGGSSAAPPSTAATVSSSREPVAQAPQTAVNGVADSSNVAESQHAVQVGGDASKQLASGGGWDDDVTTAPAATEGAPRHSLHESPSEGAVRRSPPEQDSEACQQKTEQKAQRPASKRARFASSPEPEASGEPAVHQPAPPAAVTTATSPPTTVSSARPVRPRPAQSIMRGNASSTGSGPQVTNPMPPRPGAPPLRPPPPSVQGRLSSESIEAGSGSLPVPLASSIGRPRPYANAHPPPRPRGQHRRGPQAAATAPAPSLPSPLHYAPAHPPAASPTHLTSPTLLQSPAYVPGDTTPMYVSNGQGGNSTPMQGPASNGQAMMGSSHDLYDLEKWKLSPDLRDRIAKCYHIVSRPPSLVGTRNPPDHEADARDQILDAMKSALYKYITKKGGGFKQEITDKMRRHDSRTIVWVLSADVPWRDVEREAARRHNFSFYYAADPLQDVYEIWQFNSGTIKMYTLGSLVQLIAREAARSLTSPSQEEGEVQQDSGDDLFRPEKRRGMVHKLVHPWQVEAVQALMNGQQLTTYLSETLGLEGKQADDAEAAIVLNGEQLLNQVDVIDKEKTHLARKGEFDEVELLKEATVTVDEIRSVVGRLDGEVYHTLRSLQVSWRRHKREFVLVIEPSSALEQRTIGTAVEMLKDYDGGREEQ